MIDYVRLERDHFGQFMGLFLKEKGQVRTHQRPEYVPWAFWDNPHTPEGIMTLEAAVEDGNVLGCMGVVPQVMLDGDKEISSSFFVDWLVDSDQRRRRIGSTLIRNATARFPICIHMGSTPEGYATCATLGAVDCGRTAKGRRILNPWGWSRGASTTNPVVRLGWSLRETARERSKAKFKANGLTWREVPLDQIGAQLETNARQLAHSHLTTLRSEGRWRWLLESPLYNGYAIEVTRGADLVGYAALAFGVRQKRLVGTVADISIANIEQAVPVYEAALAEIASKKCDGVTFTVSAEIGYEVINKLDFIQDGDPLMGTWLHSGYEYVPDRPRFFTMAENLSIAAGIDYPVIIPAIENR